MIPFISIGTGIRHYLFQQIMPGVQLAGDTAFPMLMREVVAPLAVPGLVGLVAAGLIGAILSSGFHDELSRHLITFDGYKRFVNPDADDKQLVRLGKWVIGLLVLGSAGLTIMVSDPNTNEPFMNYVLGHHACIGVGGGVHHGHALEPVYPDGRVGFILTGVAVSYLLPGAYAGFVRAAAIWVSNCSGIWDQH